LRLVLLREIRQRGYDGGYSMLTAFLHPMKQPVTEEVIRFETEPGFQMQVDFTRSSPIAGLRRHVGQEPRDFRQVSTVNKNPLLGVTALSLRSGFSAGHHISCCLTTPRPSSSSAMSTVPASIAVTRNL